MLSVYPTMKKQPTLCNVKYSIFSLLEVYYTDVYRHNTKVKKLLNTQLRTLHFRKNDDFYEQKLYKPIEILFLPFEYLDFILDSTRHNQLCLRRQVAAIVFPQIHFILNEQYQEAWSGC